MSNRPQNDNNESLDNRRAGNSSSRNGYVVGGLVAGLVLVAIGLIYFLLIAPSLNKAEKLADTLAKGINIKFGFTPTITINEKIYLTETKSILELAVLQKSLDVNHEFEKTIFLLPSKLKLTGKYVVKAGFDLKDRNFSIVIDDSKPIVITIYLPKPKILSTELVDYAVLKDEGILWSQITNEERQNAVNGMNEKAKQMADQNGILDETKLAIENQVREILQENAVVVKFQYMP